MRIKQTEGQKLTLIYIIASFACRPILFLSQQVRADAGRKFRWESNGRKAVFNGHNNQLHRGREEQRGVTWVEKVEIPTFAPFPFCDCNNYNRPSAVS